MARKGNPISVRLDLNRSSDSSRVEKRILRHRMSHFSARISIIILLILLLLTLSYYVSLLLGWDWNFLFLKIQSMMLGKGLSFLLKRIGWGGSLILVSIFSCVVHDCTTFNMMEASGSSGGSNPVREESNMGGGSRGSGWTSFDLDVLAEPLPDGEFESTEKTPRESSVNQPVPPANPVASPGEEASPPPVVPYPYQPDEVIGGDSVLSIQRRLLDKYVSPSSEVIERARIEAEDRFEVKVDLIRRMTPLDPEGDWLRRGARALDNPRTATGEESLERLYSLLDDLNRGGVESQAFRALKEKVFRRREDLDEHSGA